MESELPENVSTGRVIGLFIASIGSVTVPLTGKLRFTASAKVLPDPSATEPVTILPIPTWAILNAGEVYTPMADGTTPLLSGIRLIATDDPDVSKVEWTWTVEFFLDPVGGVTPTIETKTFQLPSNMTLDLVNIVTEPESSGRTVDQTLILVSAAQAYAASALGSVTAAANSATAAANSATAAANSASTAATTVTSAVSSATTAAADSATAAASSASSAANNAAAAASATPLATKLVGTALSLPGQGTDDTVMSDYGGRLLLNYGVTIPKWRLHIRNFNVNMNTVKTGALNLVGFTLGEAELVNNAPTGRYVIGTNTLLQGAATTPADGSEWVSNWFTTPLLSHKKYMLGYGFTAAADQSIYRGMGAIWHLTSGGSANVHNMATYGSRSTLVPLDIWIECEVPATTLVKGVVGDSLSVGHSSTSPVHDSFLAQHCRVNRALPVFWAASGDSMDKFADATLPKATKYNGMSRPDVLFFSLGSNDINAGATLATLQTRFAATIKVMRTIATENIVLTTIRAPEPNEADSVTRIAYTNWLIDTLPGQAVMVKDIQAPIRAADGTQNPKWQASSTNTHLSTLGYSRQAEVL